MNIYILLSHCLRVRCPSRFSSSAIELNLKNYRKIYLSHRQSVYGFYLSILRFSSIAGQRALSMTMHQLSEDEETDSGEKESTSIYIITESGGHLRHGRVHVSNISIFDLDL